MSRKAELPYPVPVADRSAALLRGRDAGWLRIRLANGMEGWVPEAAIGKL